MPKRLVGIVRIAAALSVAIALDVRANDIVRREVTIRTYNNFGVPITHMNAVRHTAEELLIGAGVKPAWRDCRTSDGPSSDLPDTCSEVLGPIEVVVRIVGAPSQWKNPESFGYSLVDAEQQRGVLSTVFADRIVTSAERLHLDVDVFLGRVVAHELGHLLLGTSGHSMTGLMRAHWPDDLLQRGFKRDWLFSPSEVGRIQEILNARIQGRPIPVVHLAELHTQ
jgi:hypothetical protein